MRVTTFKRAVHLYDMISGLLDLEELLYPVLVEGTCINQVPHFLNRNDCIKRLRIKLQNREHPILQFPHMRLGLIEQQLRKSLHADAMCSRFPQFLCHLIMLQYTFVCLVQRIYGNTNQDSKEYHTKGNPPVQ